MKSVTVYIKQRCPFCALATKWLRRKNIEFESIDVDGQELKMLKKKWNWYTVPIVIVDGELIGGYSELVQCECFHQA